MITVTPLAQLSGLGPSGGLALFFTMGMVAAVNPCGFAMLPAYLSYFLGLDDDDRRAPVMSPTPPPLYGTDSGGEQAHAVGGASSPVPVQQVGNLAQVARALRVAFTVSAGFMTVFAVAGLAVRHTSVPVYEYAPWISIVIGTALVILGVAMVRGFELTVNLPKLNRGGRERTLTSMYVFGLSYAIASIGCTLPIFLGAVAGTMNRDSFADGLVVFGLYGAGMALVLAALTMTMALARTSLVAALRSARAYVNTAAGVLVTLAGVYVVSYGVLELSTYSARQPGDIPSSPVTDMVSSWSAEVTNWVQQTGVAGVTVRLGVLVALFAGLAVLVRRRAGDRSPAAR